MAGDMFGYSATHVATAEGSLDDSKMEVNPDGKQ